MNETVLLRNQIAALTKERDEWMRSLEFSLKQRDKLTAERDALKTSNDSYITLANTAYELTEQRTAERDAAREAVISNCARVMTVTAERDALKDAARLALDALEGVVDFDPDSKAQWSVSGGAYEAHECNSAINALKAVL